MTVRLVSSFTSLHSTDSLHTNNNICSFWSVLVGFSWRQAVLWSFPQWWMFSGQNDHASLHLITLNVELRWVYWFVWRENHVSGIHKTHLQTDPLKSPSLSSSFSLLLSFFIFALKSFAQLRNTISCHKSGFTDIFEQQVCSKSYF